MPSKLIDALSRIVAAPSTLDGVAKNFYHTIEGQIGLLADIAAELKKIADDFEASPSKVSAGKDDLTIAGRLKKLHKRYFQEQRDLAQAQAKLAAELKAVNDQLGLAERKEKLQRQMLARFSARLNIVIFSVNTEANRLLVLCAQDNLVDAITKTFLKDLAELTPEEELHRLAELLDID